jgi:hypothetical protein
VHALRYVLLYFEITKVLVLHSKHRADFINGNYSPIRLLVPLPSEAAVSSQYGDSNQGAASYSAHDTRYVTLLLKYRRSCYTAKHRGCDLHQAFYLQPMGAYALPLVETAVVQYGRQQPGRR